MRWRKHEEPRDGARRCAKRFAWYPVLVAEGMYVWLEWYIVEEAYRRGFSDRGGNWISSHWEVVVASVRLP